MRLDSVTMSRPRIMAARLFVLVLLLVLAHVAHVDARQQPSSPPVQQNEFVPLDSLPPEEELPAAPLVMTAYAAAWVAILVYLWSIWRRLGRVEREIADLSRRVQHGSLAVPAPKPRGGEGGPVAPKPRGGEGG